MKLHNSLVFLVTLISVTKAANINIPEGKSIEDIFSTLNTFKTDIFSFISKGFLTPNPKHKVYPPAPPEKYHTIVIPQPHPPHVHHDLSQGIYVTSPPHLGVQQHAHFETHEPQPLPPQIFEPPTSPVIPIIKSNTPPEIQFVVNPIHSQEITSIESNIPEVVSFIHSSVKEEEPKAINEFKSENVDAHGHAGPVSFVDSERVNAGLAVAVSNALDEELIKHIPHDLWREDISAIRSHSRKVKKVKVHKKHNHEDNGKESTTPSTPELVIE